MLSKEERFIRSRCDRCGKATKAMQNNEGDLYTLPHEWPTPLGDLGDFCEPCIQRYDEANWLAWVKERYPEMCARYDMEICREKLEYMRTYGHLIGFKPATIDQ